ncbi:hypothetical protein [Kibdelosporangium phytohabitans]|uniref:Uncharacterized protein n=1 Tax=Kibdelosporangium phytohabitans TaxID=860235 RepID=A0A0N9HZS9_9PSEU|nr:hypothetical protein [Kibdelosporangium phytohabitans]ALG07667.1 hypothetical protein AOZ06_12790 [Kibdelosporangium phytohabitans]ALG07723.1 hypothetical protein AOZ06_13110 [Kibdelosporangium phytohabitans]MBE1471373.1 hypothetical protein [Kibdelosporangium phytohabitans]
MIWATPAEVREYLREELPADYPEEALSRDIDKAVRSMVPRVLRWPTVDDDTDRPADTQVRDYVIAAVAELIAFRRGQDAAAEELGGAGTAEVLAAGGSITAGKLSVSGGRGARVGRYTADRLPQETIDALLAADMIGGSVSTW